MHVFFQIFFLLEFVTKLIKKEFKKYQIIRNLEIRFNESEETNDFSEALFGPLMKHHVFVEFS